MIRKVVLEAARAEQLFERYNQGYWTVDDVQARLAELDAQLVRGPVPDQLAAAGVLGSFAGDFQDFKPTSPPYPWRDIYDQRKASTASHPYLPAKPKSATLASINALFKSVFASGIKPRSLAPPTVPAFSMHAPGHIPGPAYGKPILSMIQDAYDSPDLPEWTPPELPHTTSETPLVGYRTWGLERYEWVEPDPDLMSGAMAMPVSSMPEPYAPKRMTCHDWVLVSPTQAHKWFGPIMTADGKPSAWDPHDIAATSRPDNVHGIYAHATPNWGDFEDNGVLGKVEGVGRCVEHEDGFRAEKCRVTLLVLNPHYLTSKHNGLVASLEKRYQCEVTFDPTRITEDNPA